MGGFEVILLALGLLGMFFVLQFVLVKALGVQKAGWREFEKSGGRYIRTAQFVSIAGAALLLLGSAAGISASPITFIILFTVFLTKFMYDRKESEEPARAGVTLLMLLFVIAVVSITAI